MANHPHDCPVCDEGGECHLQDMTVMTGHWRRRYRFPKRTFRNQDLGPFVDHEMNRCIQCYRCVRFYADYAGGDDLVAMGIRNQVYFGRHEDGKLESEFSGNLVEVCPTGVFTDKTFKRHYTRKWDLQTAPSVCVHCGLGCNTIPGERYGMLRRIHSRYNGAVNGYFICDRGRFGYEFVNAESRLRSVKVSGQAATAEDAIVHVGDMIAAARIGLRRVIGIGSPRASLEANWALRKLVGPENFYLGMADQERRLVDLAQDDHPRRAVAQLLHPRPRAGRRHAHPRRGRHQHRSHARLLAPPVAPPPAHPGADRSQDPGVERRRGGRARSRGAQSLCTSSTFARPSSTAWPPRPTTPRPRISPGWASPSPTCSTSTCPRSPTCREELAEHAAEIAAAFAKAQAAHRRVGREQRQRGHHAGGGQRGLVAAHPGRRGRALFGGARVQQPGDEPHGRRHPRGGVRSRRRGRGGGGSDPRERSLSAGARRGGGPVPRVLRARGGARSHRERDLPERRISSCRWPPTPRAPGPSSTTRAGPNATTRSSPPAARSTAACAGSRIWPPRWPLTPGWQARRREHAPRPRRPPPPTGRRRAVSFGAGGGESWPGATGLLYPRLIDQLTAEIARELPVFAPLLSVAPPATYRIAGMKIARQPHRYSGRTAMHADETVFEPKPLDDPQSPLAFSMEGYQGAPPSPIIPRFWAPGWNSPQAINKMQHGPDQPLPGGDVGVRLIEPAESARGAALPRAAAGLSPGRAKASWWCRCTTSSAPRR